MPATTLLTKHDIDSYLGSFELEESRDLFQSQGRATETKIESISIGSRTYRKYTNEFWTPKQRQASSLHEIAYRACFKPQLPRFFISWISKPDDVIYDPFSGRGTTAIEAALLGRRTIANDVNFRCP